jgi:hypothetical protein
MAQIVGWSSSSWTWPTLPFTDGKVQNKQDYHKCQCGKCLFCNSEPHIESKIRGLRHLCFGSRCQDSLRPPRYLLHHLKKNKGRKRMKKWHQRRYSSSPTVIQQDMNAHCVTWARE